MRSGGRRCSTKRRSARRCLASRPDLAVTGVGGDVLFVEAASMPGRNGLVLTGQLGDVMKESARIALTYVKSHASELGIDEHALDGREVHVHVPAGAIPKDGPSAGITMVTAIASLLTRRPVKSTIGMTGEVTLQGRVLPIGGLEAEGAGRARRRAHRGDRAGAQRTRSGRRAGGGAESDDVPRRAVGRSGARRGARGVCAGGCGIDSPGRGAFTDGTNDPAPTSVRAGYIRRTG